MTELASAARSAGLDADVAHHDLHVDGSLVHGTVIERAHPHPAELARLVDDGESDAGVVVADRISTAGREVLRTAGWGWFDRRGHLRLWQPGLRIEMTIDDGTPVAQARTHNLWTPVGLEIALHALCHPTDEATARRVAPRIGRSVGATHELLARFTEVGLIGPSTNLPLLPDLFWETAAHWPDGDWIALSAPITEVAERLEPTELVRVDERAATLGGARITAAGDLPARCYLTSKSALRRVRSFVDRSDNTRTLVRLSPTRWIPDLASAPPTVEHPWRVGHPILVALRLAADPSRGREMVEDWGIVPGEAAT